MSKSDLNEKLSTKLKDDHFLYFANNSYLGILIIQKGYIKYVNKKSIDILGYTLEDISKWKKREFFKIIHPEDLGKLMQNITIEDKDAVSFQFRVLTKKGKILTLNTYLNIIKYNNERAYLVSYTPIDKSKRKDDLFNSIITRKKIEKKILIDYNPKIIKLLKDNSVKFEIIDQHIYREED